jgi:tRNA dimethylallyltransferase
MPPLVVIAGETGSGKSSLAMELAKKFDGEIICADSWTVYKDFNIGTAKPSLAERAEISHHLLDVADPQEGFSAVLFQKLALPVIADIATRGKLPILAGGTGLYIDSLIYNYGFLKAPSPELRHELSGKSLSELLELAEQKGLSTEGVDVRNKRRIIRLIENEGALPSKQELRENTLLIGLSVARDELRDRITARVDTMLAKGLEGEVATLAERYGWDAEPMKGIGYREWYEYFKGTQTKDETRRRIIKSTLDLAKRQRTWFKRNKSIQWVNNREELQLFVDLTTTFLNKR